VLPADPTPVTVNPNMAPVTLPADLEHAATEQVEWWTNRKKLGLMRH
jgi:hypothetical protein